MNNILLAPFRLNRENLQAQLSIKSGSRLEAALDKLIKHVEEIAKPKAVYRVSYIEDRGEDSVTVETTTFQSLAMRNNLDQVRRVFPFIATCGREVERFNNDEEDLLKQYWLNAIKLSLLQSSLDHLREVLKKLYRLDKLSAMNPGSGDASVWPIEQQDHLFSLFGGDELVYREVGVRLLPSYLMVPEMSVSGILFPSDTSFYNCQLCQREDCPGRRAHFDPVLWETVQNSQN
jgi:hypothetical protein